MPQLKQLPMFSGPKETFPPWQLKLIANAREKGIQEALLPIPEGQGAAKTAAYFKADNSLYNTIITSLSGDALLFATQKFGVQEDTPADAYLGHHLYQAMKAKYAGGITPQETFLLEMKILNAKCDKRDVSSSLQYIQTRCHAFITKTQADEATTLILDNKIVQVILNSLPKSYQTFVGIHRGQPQPPTLEVLIAAVEIEERTQDSSSQGQEAFAAAMIARAQARGERGARARQRGARGGVDRTSISKTKTSVKDSLYLSDFVLDSGATQHSTHNFTDLDLNTFQTCSEIILSANDSEMTRSGKGDVKIPMETSMLTLKDVRLIPASKIKLISLEKLLQEKYTIMSESPETLVLSQNNRPKLVFQIPKEGPRLYYLVRALTDRAMSAVVAVKKKKVVSSQEFAHQHFKLGHLNNQDLASALRSNGFTVTNETMKGFLCEHCLLSKSTTLSVSMPQPTIASKDTINPGDWIHSDLNGPELSYNTTKYAMDFVDEISGLISVEFIEHKGQVPKALEHFIQKCRTTSFRLEIGSNTTLHSDGDQVYKSNNMSVICASERIFQSFSPPYHANLNGVAERAWRTLGNDLRAMISSASQISDTIIDGSHWPLAMAHAAFLRNLTPSGNRKQSAYEKLTGKSPCELLSIVQPFGASCFVHDSSPEVQKLDPKAWKGYYVGFDIDSNSHKIINPITKMVTNSGNVTFDINPFNSALLKKSLELTRPRVVRKYTKNQKTVGLATLVNSPSISNDNNSATDSSVGKPSITSSEATNTLGTSVLTSKLQSGTPESVVQLESVSKSTAVLPAEIPVAKPTPVAQPTVEPPRHPNTRSQLRAMSAFTEGYKPSTEQEEDIPTVTPKSAKNALSGEFAKEWKASMLREVETLIENNVFEAAMTIPPNTKIMPSMLTFKIKDEPNLEYEKRFKSRLVVLGNHQDPDVHYNANELSSPVMKASSFRAMSAKAVAKGWSMSHVDVNSAFTNTPLKELIYMKLPKELIEMGFPSVIKLLKNLYGLHQAPKGWSDLVTDWLVEDYGFKQSISDPCVFTHPSLPLMLGLFVDDSNIIGTPEAKAAFIAAFKTRFKSTDKGTTLKYIGVNVDQSVKGSITLSQHEYIKSILVKAHMENCHPALTPAVPKTVLCAAVDEKDIKSVSDFPYAKVVGQLLWISVMTRPEIAYQVGQLAKYVSKVGKSHVDAAKYCLRYLKGTMFMGITYRSSTVPTTIQIFSDATWANDSEMKSVGGNVFLLCGGAISWRAKTQPSIAVSSCDSEYTACYDTAKEAVYMRLLLQELGFANYQSSEADFNIQTDNQAAMAVAYGTTKHEHVKHILVHIQFLRELVKSKQVSLTFVASENNVADALTKNLPKPAFDKFRQSLLGL